MSAQRGYDDENTVGFDELPASSSKPSGAWKSAVAVILSLVILVGGGYFAYTKIVAAYHSATGAADFTGNGKDDIIIKIPSGAGAESVGEMLLEANVIASTKAFSRAVSRNPEAISRMQAANYQLRTELPAAEALRRLGDPAYIVQNFVTIPEGYRIDQITTRLNETTGVSVEDLTAVIEAPGELGLPDWGQGATEGYLFPDTYSYDHDPTALALLGAMAARFNAVTGELDFVAKAAALGISPHDAVTIASIIEREVRRPEDRANVAQVIFNRLEIDMKLEMDSTVHFANRRWGEVTTTDEERNIDSPYNTYKYTGLPPGAISAPGRSSLEAAVNPSVGNYLYFVSVNMDTGETKFATTYEEHLRNVAEFQNWCQANPGKC